MKTSSLKISKCRSQRRLHCRPKLLPRLEEVTRTFFTLILEQRFQGGNQHNKGCSSFVRDAWKIMQCVGAGLDTRQGDTYQSASAWWLWKRWTFPPAGLCTEQADSQQDRVTVETWPHILSMVLHPLSCLPFSGECCRGTQHRFIVHHWLNAIHVRAFNSKSFCCAFAAAAANG